MLDVCKCTESKCRKAVKFSISPIIPTKSLHVTMRSRLRGRIFDVSDLRDLTIFIKLKFTLAFRPYANFPSDS